MTDITLEEETKNLNFLKDKYYIIERVGEGTFSVVYKAVEKETANIVALKAITKTSSPNRVLEELNLLYILEGKNNCIPFLDCMRYEDQIVAVYPYFEYTDFRNFLMVKDLITTKWYLYNLLIAIDHIHDNKIIHRDIKPGNFLFNVDTKEGILIDFGLAQFESKYKNKVPPGSDIASKPIIFFNSVISKSKPPGYFERDSRPSMKAHRAGTRGFRAPEVVFRYQYQTCAIDIWSVGVIFLSIACCQYPFFYSADDIDALVEIATIFGHKEMRKAAKFYGRIWKSNIDTIPENRIPFEQLVSSFSKCLILDDDGYDLMYRMLDLNSSTRITAKEALEHPFFSEIKR